MDEKSSNSPAKTDKEPNSQPISAKPGKELSSARRRRALREFYKLQTEAPQQKSPASESSEEDDLEKIHPESAIDKEETVEQYITKLVRTNDLKKILETENGLMNEIRSLESEKKALIYNNYSKLILAINTLDSVEQDSTVSEKTVQTLTESMKKIYELSGKLLQSCELPEDNSSHNSHTAKWLLTVPESNKRLVENGDKDGAKRQASLALELLAKVSLKGDSLKTIKEECKQLVEGEETV